jgi:plasmid replication initiation protein
MPKNNNLVVQHSALIEAHYKQTYTVQELRTVLWMICEIHKADYFKPQKYEHKTLEISAKQYADLMGINVKNVYRDAEKIADTLGSKRFTIQTENGWINLGWISSMEYKHTEGMIRVLVDPNLLPYLIDLKKYTSFRLENILNINSAHAIKIYQLLVQCIWQGERTISLDDLRSILGISNSKSYLAYKGIKQRILEISKREINEKTDLSISYTEIKKKRKVEAIKFKITQKTTQETKTNETVSA